MTNPTAATISVSSSADQRQAYLKTLLANVKAAVPDQLALPELRARADALVSEQTFPSTRQEDWRFTDLSPMLAFDFAADTQARVAKSDLTPFQLDESNGAQLVVVNGCFKPALSQLDALPEGTVVGSLQSLYGNADLPAELEAKLAQSSGGHEVFTALNTAGFQDVVVIWLPKHGVVETPIQIIYMTQAGDSPVIVQPRCLVMAESGSTATIIEDFVGATDGNHLTNTVSEIFVEPNAHITHLRVQREGKGTFHIGKTAVTQGRDSTYTSTAVALGARLSRHNWEVYQTGAQTTTKLVGLGAMADTQHNDTYSLVALNHPHGTVEQLHKCIVDNQAHCVFSGRMVVAQQAQLTNASQLNRNLLLSDRARVDTKPQLEIVADNVKCAHGATVSQLEADEIFYLQSRGINAAQAQRLLIYAFAMEIFDTIAVPSLRTALTEAVSRWT
jgi:Fe-S cluster assembly protein SufD